MRRDLANLSRWQVFLNYPFDEDFKHFSLALHFAVVAARLIPICAFDLTSPDRPRLEMLIDAIVGCNYSAHDLSRIRGEGDQNIARMNVPVEMGMAIFHASHSQREQHRCAFFVPTPHEHRLVVSDLGGLDPPCYDNDESTLVSKVYEWLRTIVPTDDFNTQPTPRILEGFQEFKVRLSKVNGSGIDGQPSHDEAQEVMYQICSESGWWDWREIRIFKSEFPEIPIDWKLD